MKKLFASMILLTILITLSGFTNVITITPEVYLEPEEKLQDSITIVDDKLNSLNVYVSLQADEVTWKYEKFVMPALKKFATASWEVPSSVLVNSIIVYAFPEGFKKEYSYEYSGESASEAVNSRSIFCEIKYSAQTKYGDNQTGSFTIYIKDSQKYIEAIEVGDKLIEKVILVGGNKERWVEQLLDTVKNDYSSYVMFVLDRDYLVSAYNNL